MYRSQVQGRTGGVQDTICTLQCMPAQSAAPQPSLMLDTDNMQGVKICSAAQRSISTYLHSAAYLHIYTISTATLINHGQTLMQNFPKFIFFTYIIISLY